MSVTHTKVSAVADDADANTVSPTDWNATHTITTLDLGATPAQTGRVRLTTGSAEGVWVRNAANSADYSVLAGNSSDEAELRAATRFAANAWNHIRASGAATGLTPVLEAIGNDTNVDLDVKPQGAGLLRTNGVPVAKGGQPYGVQATTSVSLPDTATLAQTHRMTLASTDRLTEASTARMTLAEAGVPFRGSFGLGTFEILADNYLLQYRELRMLGNARATVAGTGELFLFDLAPVGRLVLAGRGGT